MVISGVARVLSCAGVCTLLFAPRATAEVPTSIIPEGTKWEELPHSHLRILVLSARADVGGSAFNRRDHQFVARSPRRYCIASAMCDEVMFPLSATSAMVRATFSTR